MIQALDPEQILLNSTGIFGRGEHSNRPTRSEPRADLAALQIGALAMVAVRTTPCITREHDQGYSTLALLRAGASVRYSSGGRTARMGPGDIHLNPRDGGMIETGELAGLFCQIEHSRLQRTINTLGGATAQVAIACSWILQPGGRSGSHADSRPLQTWATLIDQLLSQSDHLSPALGLDDQLYRLLAHALLQASGRSDALEQRHQGCTPAWNSRLDDLVDFIRSHLHLPLTLTDLQERSHYSGRHLQNLFREHLGCTPMQFVRRQRLATAMERLQTADADTSVTRISRDCGYRFTSHFSTDFQRQFGVNPSTVLRGSRRSSP